ncbi:MAG: ABC transporter permease [bacterium]|nr:ABC transporter permease [bacterium]
MLLAEQLHWPIVDTWTITRRNLLRYVRLPRLLVFSSIQPVMFLLLFNYVFGGALGASTAAAGGQYINYLLPGILIQIVMFGGVQTGIGLAEDMGKGIIDRFRSLPMSRLAVIAGRTLADVLRNVVVVGILLIVGTLLGFHFQAGFGNALAMVGIAVLFGFTLSWVFACIGLAVRDTETAQLAGFLFIFPLVFASSVFVPVQTMPTWLQPFVKNQPITQVVNAARHFALGTPANGAVWKALLWCFVILAACMPIALWLYKRRTA